ncbi:MAG TPA: hypothetical protein VEC35_22540, partial [Noviherbaspirillum sp.]|nr:hypothetical protein [Noviherbaspirillum sp.]
MQRPPTQETPLPAPNISQFSSMSHEWSARQLVSLSCSLSFKACNNAFAEVIHQGEARLRIEMRRSHCLARINMMPNAITGSETAVEETA